MKIPKCLIAGLTTGVLCTGFAATRTTSPTVAHEKATTHEIPFRLQDNLIVVQATINGKGPLKLMVDTGADWNQLLPGAAKRVGLIDDSFKKLASVKGAMQIGSVEGADEEFRIENYPALVSINRNSGIEGTIGYPFLTQYHTVIEYKQKKLFLRRYNDTKVYPQLADLIKRRQDAEVVFQEERPEKKKLRDAAEALEKIFDEAPKGTLLAAETIFNAARSYCYLKDPERAVACLTKMHQAGLRFKNRLHKDEAFEKIRDDPKYQELLKSAKDDPKKLYFENDRYHVVFEGYINQKGPFRFLLDTGSAYVTITLDVKNQLGLKSKTVPSIRIGTTEMKNIVVDWNSPATALMKQFGTDVLLGTPFLNNYKLTIDFLNQELSLDPLK